MVVHPTLTEEYGRPREKGFTKATARHASLLTNKSYCCKIPNHANRDVAVRDRHDCRGVCSWCEAMQGTAAGGFHAKP